MIGAWGAWLPPTAIVAGLVALACLALERIARMGPRPATALLLVALLQFVVPPFLRLPLLSVAGVAGSGIGPGSATGVAWLDLLVLAQAAGIAVGLALLARSMFTVRRTLGASELVTSGPVLRELDGVARTLGSRTPRLYLTSDFGPSAVGVLRPSVALPRSLPGQLTREELRQVLVHEVAHVVRRDPLAASLRWVVLAAWWFHPVAWLVARRHHTLVEQACDDIVLDRGLDDAAAYCRTLVKCARVSSASPLAVPAIGGSSMARRIRRIFEGSPRPPRRPGLERALLAAALLTLPLGMAPRERQPPPQGAPEVVIRRVAPPGPSRDVSRRRVRRKTAVIVR